ncbi:MAG: hypothetical protein H7X80_03505, partial [bacterium]|nr:hypothetical protein [Candidatus Kapabacteria bacterium]
MTNLTADLVHETYRSFIDRIASAEAAATADEWMFLIDDWNTFNSFVWSEMSRVGMRADSGVGTPDDDADSDRISIEVYPILDDEMQKLFGPLLTSRHRAAVAEHHGNHFFNLLEQKQSTFDDESTREAMHTIATAYARRVNAVRPIFDGQAVTRGYVESLCRSPDAKQRRDAFIAMNDALLVDLDKNALDVDELIRLQSAQALSLGFPDFVGAAYASMGRTDFGPDDLERFHDSIERHFVPIASRLVRDHANRLGAERLPIADMFYDPAHSLPRGIAGPVDTLVDRMKSLFDALSPALGEHFRRLVDWGTIDIEQRIGKHPGASCATLFDEGRVAVTMNAVGDASDVTVLLHEMGHAFQVLESRDIPLITLRRPGRELAEVHSTAMEFLGARYAEHVLPPQYCDQYRRNLWHTSLRPICAITRTDVYQHWIHRNPESGTADRETKWIELEKRFTPGIDWTGFERYRRTPIYATPQIYRIPFGMVDYALAKIVAMQIARIDHDDHERAMGVYIDLCRLG